MLVMFDVTDRVKGAHHDQDWGKREVIELKGLFALGEDFVRTAVEALVQAAVEAEIAEGIGDAEDSRSETRL
jgi:hypothetical protein